MFPLTDAADNVAETEVETDLLEGVGEPLPTTEHLSPPEATSSTSGGSGMTCSSWTTAINCVKTMKVETKYVTNLKEDDEVYVPLVKDRMLKMVTGANTCMTRVS